MASLLFWNGAFWIIAMFIAVWLVKIMQRVKLVQILGDGVRSQGVVRIEGIRVQYVPFTRDTVQQILRQRSSHTPILTDKVRVSAHIIKESCRLVMTGQTDLDSHGGVLTFKLQAISHAKVEVFVGLQAAALNRLLAKYEEPDEEKAPAQSSRQRSSTRKGGKRSSASPQRTPTKSPTRTSTAGSPVPSVALQVESKTNETAGSPRMSHAVPTQAPASPLMLSAPAAGAPTSPTRSATVASTNLRAAMNADLFAREQYIGKASAVFAPGLSQEGRIVLNREWWTQFYTTKDDRVAMIIHVKPIDAESYDSAAAPVCKHPRSTDGADEKGGTGGGLSSPKNPGVVEPSEPVFDFTTSRHYVTEFIVATLPPRDANAPMETLENALGRVKFERQLVFPTSEHLVDVQDVFGMDEESQDCTICWSDPKEVILLPCRHVNVCNNCMQNLSKCPVCRAPITNFLRFTTASTGPASPPRSPPPGAIAAAPAPVTR